MLGCLYMKRWGGLFLLFVFLLLLIPFKKIYANYYLDYYGKMRYQESREVLGIFSKDYKYGDNDDDEVDDDNDEDYQNNRNNQFRSKTTYKNSLFQKFFNFFRVSPASPTPTPEANSVSTTTSSSSDAGNQEEITPPPNQENPLPTTAVKSINPTSLPDQTTTNTSASESTQTSGEQETPVVETPSEYFATNDEIINLQNIGGEISIVKEYKSGAMIDYGKQKKFVIEVKKRVQPSAPTFNIQQQEELQIERKVDYDAIQQFFESTPKSETEETIEVFSSQDGYIVFAKGATGAKTRYALSVNPTNNQLLIRTESGLKKIVYLPDQAIDALIKNDILHIVSAENSTDTANIKNVLPLEIIDGIPVYQIVGERKGKLFNLIPVNIAKTVVVSAENGDVIKENLSLSNRILNALSY